MLLWTLSEHSPVSRATQHLCHEILLGTCAWESRCRPLQRRFGGSGGAQNTCSERQGKSWQQNGLGWVGKALTAMDAAVPTFLSAQGDAERWELATVSGMCLEKVLRTTCSCSKKEGISWRKPSKDSIWARRTTHTVQLGKSHLRAQLHLWV